ncbi:hypothetical protein B1A_07228 [mine drainage metagenome]|uniref:Uncharacterized protein n=1 Tax=mine drainage metagenome TaxID=410659 RepID=T1B6U2_9ZZZZ
MTQKTIELIDRATERKVSLPVHPGTIGPSVVDIAALNKEFGLFTYDPRIRRYRLDGQPYHLYRR